MKRNTIILYPGSFKPMHAGHVDLIKRYLNHPKVKQVKVLIGSGIRDGVSQEEALIIATELLNYVPNVSLELSKHPSPILTAYKYIETANPGTYAMAGVKKGDDYDRVLKFVTEHQSEGKYYHLKPKNVHVTELEVNVSPLLYVGRTDEYNAQPISSTVLRRDMLNNDFYNFETNYPGFSEELIKKIWDYIQASDK